MNGRRPTPILATNLVSEERDFALRGFVSPLGSRARQTSMSGSLGTLALYPEVHDYPDADQYQAGRRELREPQRLNDVHSEIAKCFLHLGLEIAEILVQISPQIG
jgi:hypothetical protein